MFIQELDQDDDNNIVEYSNGQRRSAQVFTCISAGFGVLFAYFLYVACTGIIDDVLDEAGIENEATRQGLEVAFKMIIAMLSLMNLISDTTSVNPIEDAEAILMSFDRSTELLQENVPPGVNLLTKINKVLAFPVFAVGASADLVTMCYLSSQLGMRLGIGIPATVLGISYYYMFSGANLRKHAVAIVNEIQEGFPALTRVRRSLARFLESNLQIFSNVAYRSIAMDYILTQFMLELFEYNIDLFSLSATTLLTAYVTLQSRALPVYARFFNPEFDTIVLSELRSVRIPKRNIFTDLLMSLLRGGSLGTLLSRHALPANLAANLLLSISVSGVFVGHNFYALQQTRRFEIALLNQPQTAPIPSANIQLQRPEQLFDAIADYYKTSRLKHLASIVNTGARMVRWIAFFGFIISVKEALKAKDINISLDLRDVFCLASLWGIPTLVADGKVFQAEFERIWSYYCAKIRIGAVDERATQSNVFFRGVRGFFTPKQAYDPNRLASVLQEIRLEVQQTTALIKN